MKTETYNKTGFIIPNKQQIYLHIGQRLKDVAYIYSQFTNTIFGLLPKVQKILQMPTFINICKKNLFNIYINDYIGAAKIFEAIYIFLYDNYFLRVAFGLIYLSEKKTKAFVNILKLLGFEKSCEGLRPSVKHQNKIEQMPISIS